VKSFSLEAMKRRVLVQESDDEDEGNEGMEERMDDEEGPPAEWITSNVKAEAADVKRLRRHAHLNCPLGFAHRAQLLLLLLLLLCFA
jgi:hypothetical protein